MNNSLTKICMNKISIIIALVVIFSQPLIAQEVTIRKEFSVDKTYLLFPVNRDGKKFNFDFKSENFSTYFNFRLATHKDSVDYWVFMDVSRFKNRKSVLSSPDLSEVTSLSLIHLANEIESETPIYQEELRQQIHFSGKRGWNNDPNGLVYYDGEYHLYYQHNPYDWAWGNMHWGHAISKDLVHWEELPIVMYPDELGTMFSGSAIVDKRNVSGFKTGDEDVIVYFYSTNSDKIGQTQCLAYSNDRGRTLKKYENNPILPAIKRFGTNDERDPKVFWYKEGEHWVMVLFEGLGQSIYTSENLKDWKYESHVKGFWECPELFELPIDGDEDNKKWVLYGASGTYKIGTFNGKIFVPETDKLEYLTGEMYAAQTYNNVPDGRRIQIGWGTIKSEGMAFNQMMCFPNEMKLKSTKQGPRMHVAPIEEISKLYKKSWTYKNLIFGENDINKEIEEVNSPLLHIKTTIQPLKHRKFTIDVNGYKFIYNLNDNKLNDTFVPLIDFKMELEFIVDVNSIEVFINGGQQVIVLQHNSKLHTPGIRFFGKNETLIDNLEIHELESIW